MNQRIASAAAIFVALAGGWCPLAATSADAQEFPAATIERGRYLVKTTLCVACHSTGYEMSAGKLPESQWLTGNQHGFTGPWGTTYPINLRLYMQPLSADEWLKAAHTMTARPPMQWYVVREMNDDDLLAIYAFIKSLSPLGSPAPAYQPPDAKAAAHP